MAETSTQKTRNKLAKAYGAGILVFSGIVAFITLLYSFLAHVNLS
jgi:hypothetical protein